MILLECSRVWQPQTSNHSLLLSSSVPYAKLLCFSAPQFPHL